MEGWKRKVALELRKPRSFSVLVMTLTVFFLFADQNLLAPNLQAAADDFGFTEEEKDMYLGGYIALGFFIIGGLASCLIGYWTDTCVRTRLFGYVIIFGEASCALTYWVRTFWELFACRVLTGIAVGGSIPLMFSMIGDLYAVNERVLVSTCLTTATGAGIAFGQVTAAYVGVRWGWRAPFLVVAIPSLLCGAVMYSCVKEPVRGEADAAHIHGAAIGETSALRKASAAVPGNPVYEERITWEKLRILFGTPSFLLSLAQGVPGCLPWGMMFTFMNDYLHHNRGLSVLDATYLLTVFGVAGIFGALFGGHVGQWLFNRSCTQQIALMSGSTLVGMLPVLYLINAQGLQEPRSYPLTIFMAALGGFVININGPNIKVLLCNVVVPEARGCAFAVFALTDDIGKGLGPFIVSLFIEAFHGSRVLAFNIITVGGWGLCGITLLCLAFTYANDMAMVEQAVKEALCLHTSSAAPSYTGSDEEDEEESTKSSLHALLVDEDLGTHGERRM